MTISPKSVFTLTLLAVTAAPVKNALAMHIADGILPPVWAGVWWLVALPFMVIGFKGLTALSRREGHSRQFAALTGAAVFIISCMPVPVPVAGSTAHPCGAALAAVMIGVWPSVAVTATALLLQALFLAHGGLTTLGANTVAMGVTGVFIGYAVFAASRRVGWSVFAAGFAAGMLSHLAVYAVTSLQLTLALHGDVSPVTFFAGIAAAFAPTQLPLSVLEGAVTGAACRFVFQRRPEFMAALKRGAA